ncbi:MAG: prolipoprotein diacylglyceryl transferase [Candidatus Woesearchaeota archaeon]
MFSYQPHDYLLGLGNFMLFGENYRYTDVAYMLLLNIGILVMLWIALREGKKRGLKKKHLIGCFIAGLLGSGLGGRIAYLLFWKNPDTLSEFLIALVDIKKYYVVSSGAIFGAAVGAALYCYLRKISFWKYADVYALGWGIVVVFGRLGCFVRGCCYGVQTSVPWGVWYREAFRHPWPLYDALNGLFVFLVLQKLKKRRMFNGALLLYAAILYSFGRVVLEFFRSDKLLFEFTISQYIYGFFCLIAIVLLLYLKTHSNNRIRINKIRKQKSVKNQKHKKEQ